MPKSYPPDLRAPYLTYAMTSGFCHIMVGNQTYYYDIYWKKAYEISFRILSRVQKPCFSNSYRVYFLGALSRRILQQVAHPQCRSK